MATTILPYRNLGETLGVHLDLAHVPHKKNGENSFFVDRAEAGDTAEIGIEVQVPSGIKTVFPPSERKQLALEVLATVTSIDGSMRQAVPLKRRKSSLYTGKFSLDLTRISEAARVRAYVIRTKDCAVSGYAGKKGSRLAWGPESDIRFAERTTKGHFLRTVWEDFSDSVHVPRHFENALYYADAVADPPVLYLNKMANAPLVKLLETEGHGHPKALPRDIIFRSIATNVWLILAQVTLEALHMEAVDNGSPVDPLAFFEGSWKTGMVELLAPALYPNLMPEEALLQLGMKIEDKNFYADALLRTQLAVQANQKIREHFEQFAEKVFENG
jgi:hypothetical protein